METTLHLENRFCRKWLEVQHCALPRPSGVFHGVPTTDFTSSGSLDGRQLSVAIYFEHRPTCRSNQQHVAFAPPNQRRFECPMGLRTIILVSRCCNRRIHGLFSPNGGNFRRHGFPQRNKSAVLLSVAVLRKSVQKLCSVFDCMNPHVQPFSSCSGTSQIARLCISDLSCLVNVILQHN